ncbi:MAG: hypothetical protein O7C59_02980 [Rickettsia endosymbiont of Ixodes persulcatus]|nr:hypothetical protein [Rickettsia endosymbiont of Ixodes persulcatus]MCZ6913544.1 hypothetical protein [Rickettsia endosymbiont of Ixodes persulcatus]MCZ6920137.1 hypothetical protein [Rickettsia endosymbiont of Ixodes persulcatus]MCZ6924064.1 hypothetical protein [Rickettsia endosymbiont of Ixodes persulcatus]
MQCQHSYDNTVIKKQNIDTKTANNITYNYKRRREELNEIVGRNIERQKQRATQKKNSVAV